MATQTLFIVGIIRNT